MIGRGQNKTFPIGNRDVFWESFWGSLVKVLSVNKRPAFAQTKRETIHQQQKVAILVQIPVLGHLSNSVQILIEVVNLHLGCNTSSSRLNVLNTKIFPPPGK